jgi:hypothetical protein
MVFSKSLDKPPRLWRGSNVNYANEVNFANLLKKFAFFALFATFALMSCRF